MAVRRLEAELAKIQAIGCRGFSEQWRWQRRPLAVSGERGMVVVGSGEPAGREARTYILPAVPPTLPMSFQPTKPRDA